MTPFLTSVISRADVYRCEKWSISQVVAVRGRGAGSRARCRGLAQGERGARWCRCGDPDREVADEMTAGSGLGSRLGTPGSSGTRARLRLWYCVSRRWGVMQRRLRPDAQPPAARVGVGVGVGSSAVLCRPARW